MKKCKGENLAAQPGDGSARGAKGRSTRGLELQSVFLFTPHYLLTVHPANERQYKAVGGDSDISTQAGSLETFELLARMAAWNGLDGGGSGCKREPGGVPGWDGVPGVASLGWLGGNRQNQQRVTRTPRY